MRVEMSAKRRVIGDFAFGRRARKALLLERFGHREWIGQRRIMCIAKAAVIGRIAQDDTACCTGLPQLFQSRADQHAADARAAFRATR